MIKILPSVQEINTFAATYFASAANAAIESKGYFTVALTGGSSPVGLYRLLSEEEYKQQIDWSKVFFFWGDERWVPLESDQSNAKMSFQTLLSHIPVPSDHIFPMYKDGVEPEVFASMYADILKDKLGPKGAFDLILLGVGNDGHTASLFPGTEVLEEKDNWVSAYYLEPQQMYRITLTAPLINKAEKILVIAFGDAKAEALSQVLEGEFNPTVYPAQLLKPADGELLFLMDDKAAAELTEKY